MLVQSCIHNPKDCYINTQLCEYDQCIARDCTRSDCSSGLLFQLSICIMFLFRSRLRCRAVQHLFWMSIHPNLIAPYLVPALLYCINANLAVHIQPEMDPITYQVQRNNYSNGIVIRCLCTYHFNETLLSSGTNVLGPKRTDHCVRHLLSSNPDPQCPLSATVIT